MPTRAQLTEEKVQALLAMIKESGASTKGNMPPVKYIEALFGVAEIGEANDVAHAHRNNEPP